MSRIPREDGTRGIHNRPLFAKRHPPPMTTYFWLDWPLLAISLVNVILLTWLGLTVLLQAARRTWGVWLAALGLLGGGAFFVSHTAILGLGPTFAGRGLELWWRAGWIPLAALPLTWYGLVLWYAGFWEAGSPLHRHHGPGLGLGAVLLILLLAFLLIVTPLPAFHAISSWTRAPIPAILLLFPIYILLCTGMALYALIRPGPSAHQMGDEARRRARPWLVGASGLLMVISLLVAAVIARALYAGVGYDFAAANGPLPLSIGVLDLLISAAIASAAFLVGRAIVSYEIFTGQRLPRSELAKSWANVLVLAAGFGGVVALPFALNLPAIYVALLTALIMSSFYALSNWRSALRRERYARQLRPLLTGQRLYTQLLNLPPTNGQQSPLAAHLPPSAAENLPIEQAFSNLCRDLLESAHACLTPVGAMAPLLGPALFFPHKPAHWGLDTAFWIQRFTSPTELCAPVGDPALGDMVWAVPLWSERGLVGLLFLGPKRQGALYTQEEIELAQASCERLVDNQASVQMVRTLMQIQRQRLAESQLLDQRTRRALHDELLPQLHTALLALSGEEGPAIPSVMAQLTAAHGQIADLLRSWSRNPVQLTASGPGLLKALRQLAQDEFAALFDRIDWTVDDQAPAVIAHLPPASAEVIYFAVRELMRNAARYGRGDPPIPELNLRLIIQVGPNLGLAHGSDPGLIIAVEDDGVGIQPAGTEAGGAQQGLSLHSTMLAVIGGVLSVESRPGLYTRAVISLADPAFLKFPFPPFPI